MPPLGTRDTSALKQAADARPSGDAGGLSSEAIYNRTLDGIFAKLPYVYYQARTTVFRQHGARTAYTFRDKALVPIMYSTKMHEQGPPRDFARFATSWELKHSRVPFGDGHGNVDPVVDENMTVIGHYGSFDSSSVFVPNAAASAEKTIEAPLRGVFIPGQRITQVHRSGLDLEDMLEAEFPVFASRHDEAAYRNRGYQTYPTPQRGFTLLTDIEGEIMLVMDSRDRDGITPSAFSPLDLITVARLVLLGVSAVAGALAVRTLMRRRAARALQQSAKRELGPGGGEGPDDWARREALRAIRGNPPAVNIGAYGESGNLIARVDIVEGKVIYRVSAIIFDGGGSTVPIARAAHREMIRRAAQQAQKNGQKQFILRGIDANANFQKHADKLAGSIGVPRSGKVIAGSGPGFSSYEVTLDVAKVLRPGIAGH